MEEALVEEGRLKISTLKRLYFCCIDVFFLLQSKPRKTILTEIHRKFCRPSALLSLAFGRVELRALIIKPRDLKR